MWFESSPITHSGVKIRDRHREASRLSTALSFGANLTLGFYLLANPQFLTVQMTVIEPEPISIEVIEMIPPAPEPVVVPEPEPVVEPEPIIEPGPIVEPKPVVEPAPTPKPAPVPKPKPEPKPAPKPKPKALPPKAESKPAPAPAKAAAPAKAKASNFVGDFVATVERSKFYPKAARQAGITGTVKVRVSFDGSGQITGYSLVSGSYHPSLGEAALSTMAKVKGRWKPKGGGPSSLVVPIGFRLK